MGNPHAVLRVTDVESAPVEAIGRALQQHPRFPKRVNVGFMQVVEAGHIRLRVYERGVGETLACGTGICAAVAVGRAAGPARARMSKSMCPAVNWAYTGTVAMRRSGCQGRRRSPSRVRSNLMIK